MSFSLGERTKAPTFALPLQKGPRLPDSIMVVQLILVQFVLVRIQVGQQKPFRQQAEGFCFSGSVPNLFGKAEKQNGSY